MRAFHFIAADLRTEEDLMLGLSSPWRIGETRTYKPFSYDFGDGETHWQHGYESSPTLWEAFGHCDGPVACLVDISEPVHSEVDEHGRRDFSATRKLVAIRDLSRELRQFAVSCAETAINRASADLATDGDVRSILQSAQQPSARGDSSSRDESIFQGALDLASRSGGLRGGALCVAAAACYPEAQDAALLVVDMSRELSRIAGQGQAADLELQRALFDLRFSKISIVAKG